MLLILAGCVSPVSSGLPPLTAGCQTAADCSAAGPAFQCVAGGCLILACSCDSDCADAGLRCFNDGYFSKQCQPVPASVPDGGTPCAG